MPFVVPGEVFLPYFCTGNVITSAAFLVAYITDVQVPEEVAYFQTDSLGTRLASLASMRTCRQRIAV